jgi:hypothetical protein
LVEADSPSSRLKRLANKIDALEMKDAEILRSARQVTATRRKAASDLYELCRSFVAAVNALLANDRVVLDPPHYTDEAFRDDSANLIQMNIRGRILQVEFEVTPELVSTEDFRIPYTLQGFVRGFNQELLEKDLIEEQLIFYTLEKPQPIWRFFDVRTHRSGRFDQEYLISLMERLV